MALVFVVKNDHIDGKEFTVQVGQVIGREGADIVLNDKRVSGQHAQVERNPAGDFFLVDLGSTNGIRSQNGKVKKLFLQPGTEFRIGNTEFQVIDDRQKIPGLIPFRSNVEVSDWRSILQGYLDQSLKVVKNETVPLKAFPKPLLLEVTQGLQIPCSWVVGYGPRVFGARHIEFQILEPGAPDTCFKLIPEKGGVLFCTDYPIEVQLNGRALKEEILEAGDYIQIRNTRISVNKIK